MFLKNTSSGSKTLTGLTWITISTADITPRVRSFAELAPMGGQAAKPRFLLPSWKELDLPAGMGVRLSCSWFEVCGWR